mgnify:FL=1
MTEDEGADEAPRAGESDATADRRSDWSAVPQGSGGDELDIPLPWNTVSTADPDADAAASGEGSEEPLDDAASDGEAGATDDSTAADTASTGDETPTPERFEDLRFVGPKSAAVLRDSDVSLSDLVEKRIGYRDLTDAGVNPGVAAKIRREHSLSWSLDGGGSDLDRRSTQVRGLDDDERAWIAASSGWSEEETATETDGSGEATDAEAAWRARTGADAPATTDEESVETDGEAAWREQAGDPAGAAATGGANASERDAETAWREQSVPTPVTALDGIDDRDAAALHRAGIGSIRRLATADPESVADALELRVGRVETWCELAREHES